MIVAASWSTALMKAWLSERAFHNLTSSAIWISPHAHARPQTPDPDTLTDKDVRTSALSQDDVGQEFTHDWRGICYKSETRAAALSIIIMLVIVSLVLWPPRAGVWQPRRPLVSRLQSCGSAEPWPLYYISGWKNKTYCIYTLIWYGVIGVRSRLKPFLKSD